MKKITDYLTEREVTILEKYCSMQYSAIMRDGLDEEEIISFLWDGISIFNPFVDETARFEVDPVKYYGESFLDSGFMELFSK